MSVIFSPVTYLQRPETVELILLAILHLFISKKSKVEGQSYAIVCGVLIAVIGLIHPVGGFFALFFLSAYTWESKVPIKKFVSCLIVAAFVGLALYIPVILINYGDWKLNFFTRLYTNEDRAANIENIIQFINYAIPFGGFCIFFFCKITRKNLLKETAIFIFFVLILLPFGKYYYFIYLFQVIFWRITALEFAATIKSWQKAILIAAFIPGFIQIGLLPLFQIFENPGYAYTYTKTLKRARQIAFDNPGKNIWVSPFLGMAVIDQPNSRLHYLHYVKTRGEKPILKNDIFLVEHTNMKEYIESYTNTNTDSLSMISLIPPVQGLILFGIHNKRSDSLGLWVITIVKK